MKNFLLGVAIGAITTYIVYKLVEEGKLDFISDDVHKFKDKARKKIKNGLDIAQNNVEYLEDRLKHKSQEVKNVIGEISNKIAPKEEDKATN